ncbi:hypothetical protein [Streptosporangium lutulentum]|uniref:hypothetical protein n=1 Tax=Streptosporangium lutulentum TaxID=1461250 RepID=UPI003630E4E0
MKPSTPVQPVQTVLPLFDVVSCLKCGRDKTAFIRTDPVEGCDIHECLFCGHENKVINA